MQRTPLTPRLFSGFVHSIDGTAQMKIHKKYDLKGSKVHRTAKEGEKVLKDNNLREAKTKFRLGSQRDAFLKVITLRLGNILGVRGVC